MSKHQFLPVAVLRSRRKMLMHCKRRFKDALYRIHRPPNLLYGQEGAEILEAFGAGGGHRVLIWAAMGISVL